MLYLVSYPFYPILHRSPLCSPWSFQLHLRQPTMMTSLRAPHTPGEPIQDESRWYKYQVAMINPSCNRPCNRTQQTFVWYCGIANLQHLNSWQLVDHLPHSWASPRLPISSTGNASCANSSHINSSRRGSPRISKGCTQDAEDYEMRLLFLHCSSGVQLTRERVQHNFESCVHWKVKVLVKKQAALTQISPLPRSPNFNNMIMLVFT